MDSFCDDVTHLAIGRSRKRHSRRSGLTTHFYADGTMAAEGRYFRGEPHGPWSYWHPDGQRATQGEWRRGKKHGLWTTWTVSGEVSVQTSYRDGVKLWAVEWPAATVPT